MIILSIISFVVIFGLLILVHELGHFVSAKIFGVKVEEFGFGYPPRLTGRTIKGTLYSLNWIPVGGFVKIEGIRGGDQADSPASQNITSFTSKPRWQRFTIIFAGIAMNLVLAAVLFSIVLMIGARSTLVMEDLPANAIVSQPAITVVNLDDTSTAYLAGLRVGDSILAIDNQPATAVEKMRLLLQAVPEQIAVQLTVQRGAEEIQLTLIPVPLDDKGTRGIGAYFADTGIVRLPVLTALRFGFIQSGQMFIAIILAFGQMISQLFGGESIAGEVSGPLGIASLTHQATQLGIVYVIQFAGMLSVNLAVFNLLPIPALDGGRLAFLVVETVLRRPVNQKIEAVIHNVGFLVLLLVIMLITIKDVIKLF